MLACKSEIATRLMLPCPCGCGHPVITHHGPPSSRQVHPQASDQLDRLTKRYRRELTQTFAVYLRRALEALTGATVRFIVHDSEYEAVFRELLDQLTNVDGTLWRYGEEASALGSQRLMGQVGAITEAINPLTTPYFKYLREEGFTLLRDSVWTGIVEPVRQYVVDQITTGASMQEAARRGFHHFETAERYKWERLARSEAVAAHARGYEAQAVQDGIAGFLWVTAPTQCAICAPLDGKVFPVNGDHPLPEIDTHPNCLCDLVAQIAPESYDSWDEARAEMDAARAALWTQASVRAWYRGRIR